MRVKLEPDTAFIGRKFAYIFLGVIFSQKPKILKKKESACIPTS